MADYWFNTPDYRGVIAATIAEDPNDPNYVYDLQAFANMNAFKKHMDMEDTENVNYITQWLTLNDKTVPFTGTVWGDDTEGYVKKMTT